LIIASVLRATSYRVENPEGDFPAHVLSDCTNNGISSQADELAVVNAEGPHGSHGRPLVAIVPGNAPGTIKAVPVIPIIGQPVKFSMMGGNFLHSSDSRFREICESALADSWAKAGMPGAQAKFYGAVAIHDRIEG
jgi:hypothetical protein